MLQRKIAILTDSACDMPPEMQQERNVDILCFNINVDGQDYTERVDFDFDDYYEILRGCQKVPSTSQITTTRFLEQFKKYDDEGVGEVLYVSINAGGSATHDAALMAREKFKGARPGSPLEIAIVDSRTYSMAYGWFVAEAARKLRNGAEMRDVVDWLEDVFARTEIVLAAFSLKFIKKSGRVSAAAAFAGELLGLKPIISLIDGESVVQKKVRGEKEVLPALVDYMEANMDKEGEYYGFYAAGGTNADVIAELAALGKKRFKTPPVATFKLGAAVSTNTGPDAIALVYLGKRRG